MSGDEGSKSGTAGSGTRPEGHTRRDPPDRRAGHSSASGDPLIGAVLLDRYRVARRIGSGGMGTVYAAEQVSVGREVALKILRSDLVGQEGVRLRFRREAEVIARLSHPSTIRLIDYGETADGRAVMVMELLEGVPLNERLRAEGPMEVEEVLRIGEEVARALAEA
ncbi:MAG: protein kinase, partial [Myxococcota bacterium]